MRDTSATTLQVGRWQQATTRGLATPSGQYDAVVIGGGTFAPSSKTEAVVYNDHSFAGPGGYVAAIKAAQLGLKVRSWLRRPLYLVAHFPLDSMYRKARNPRRDVLECRLHTLQGNAQQLAHLPPNAP